MKKADFDNLLQGVCELKAVRRGAEASGMGAWDVRSSGLPRLADSRHSARRHPPPAGGRASAQTRIDDPAHEQETARGGIADEKEERMVDVEGHRRRDRRPARICARHRCRG